MMTKENKFFIWEEKNSIEPKKNSENRNGLEISVITKNTEKKCEKKECERIGNKKIWKRTCPKCELDIFHTSKSYRNYSNKNKIKCFRCAHDERVIKDFGDFVYIDGNKRWIRKCPNCNKEILHKIKWVRDNLVRKNCVCKLCHYKLFHPSKDQIERQRSKLIGRKVPQEQKEKAAKASRERVHTQEWHDKIGKSNRGKKRSPETRKKMRVARINYIKSCYDGQMSPSYNKKSCEYFKKMERKKKWDGYYATKNGEYFIKDLGYWVDYYEPNKNVVIEWDEKSHYNIDRKLKWRDHYRMLEIKNYLKCRFLRFNEKLNEMKEY